MARGHAMDKPPPGTRTDLVVTAEPDLRLGNDVRFSVERRVVFEEPRRDSGGGTVDYAGVTWERVDAEDGVIGPCPSVDRPGPPRLFSYPVQSRTPPPGRTGLVTGRAGRRDSDV